MQAKLQIELLANDMMASSNMSSLRGLDEETILGCIESEYIQFSNRLFEIAKLL